MSTGSPPGKWTVFGLVAVGVFMSTLDGSIVNIALPILMEDYGVTMATVKWVMMVYLLSVSSLLLSFGRLSDIRGRRWVYFRGFLLFTFGSLLCALAPGIGWLVSARAIQGAGAAMLMACSPALVVDTFPENERGRALGALGTVVAAGLTTGPALGGVILHYADWRGIFLLNLPIGLVSAALAQKWLKGGPGDRRRRESFDLIGGAALAGGLCFLILAVTKGQQWGLSDPRTLCVSGLATGFIVLLVLRCLRVDNPVFEPALLKVRLFLLPAISAMLLFVCLFSMMFLMPFYLMHPAGYTVAGAGSMMTVPFVALFFVAPTSGWGFDRIGSSRGICTLGMILLALSLYLLSELTATAGPVTIAWRMALAGVGTALFTPPNNSVTMGSISQRFRGVAAATTATARNIGMVGGVAMGGLVFNHIFFKASGGEVFSAYRPQFEQAFMTAFRCALGATVGVAVLGAIVSFLRGPETRRPPSAPGGEDPWGENTGIRK
jgi:EmrB/QacA subfamily drug resistance transporter